jgi:type I restriction enzyme S subunit
MNAKLLLAHFNRISDAPDAVPRLRRFILDLAVRGKLVEQDSNDEPVTALVKRIQREKARLVERGDARKQKPLVLLDTDAFPFTLPLSWQWSQLAEIGFINPRNSAEDGDRSSFVQMSSISAEYGVANAHEVRPWGDIKSGFTHFAEGDVGLAKITPCFENGKSTVFRSLEGTIGAGTTELHVVRPVFVSADYILIFLKSPYFIESGIPKMTGTAGQKRVSTEYFAYSPFPLPPREEQHRIVAKVDELMALCDRLETAQRERESHRDRLAASAHHHLNNGTDVEALPTHAQFFIGYLPRLTARSDQIKQLRQTILNLAVRGKVVAQVASDEPALKLLKRIQSEKEGLISEGRIRREGAPTPPSAEELGFTLPHNWAPVRLGQILMELQTGPFGSSLHQSDYQKGGTPVINPASIRDESIIPFDGMAVGPATLERLATFKLREGDIVMARRGEMGRCAVVTHLEDGWLCGTGSLILRLPSCVSAPFLVQLIGSPPVRAYLGGSAVGATMQNLNQSILLNLIIGLPPVAEQHRIVAKVDELMALCDQLEARLTTAQTEASRLLESVLYNALNVPAPSQSTKLFA